MYTTFGNVKCLMNPGHIRVLTKQVWMCVGVCVCVCDVLGQVSDNSAVRLGQPCLTTTHGARFIFRRYYEHPVTNA